MRRKVNGPSNNTTKPITQLSKIDILPKILKYPRYLPFFTTNPVSPGDSVKNVLCYVMQHYGDNGLTLLIYWDKKTAQIVVQCGDWDGNNIDLTDGSKYSDAAKELINTHLENLLGMMKYANIDQAQIYFALYDEQFMIVDVQTAINKFSGPGMIRDIFSKICMTPQILKIEPLDERAINAIREGTGSYTGDLIIKPSRYRVYEDGLSNYRPLYLEVRR